MSDQKRLVSLTLRMPPELHVALAARVEATGRSLNGEVVRMLENGLRETDLIRSVRETIRAEMRAEFEGRHGALDGPIAWGALPSHEDVLNDLCGPAAYHRINGSKAD